MNKKELNFILQEGEGFKLEFKEGIGGIDKDMVAFANAEGGRIFIGIDDNKTIKGIKFTNKLKAQINDIAKNCDPSVKITVSCFGHIVIVEVFASENKPHRCSSGFYLREDSVSQKMTRDELVDFIFDQGRKKFDSLICHKFNLKDLDKDFLKEYFKRAGITAKVPASEILFNLGIYDNAKINNAGALFFSKFPKRYFIHAYITCARYLGTDKVEVLDRADFEGNIVRQVDETIKFIRRNTRLSYKIRDIKREEISEYPIEALREAVVNAIMHRDYFETGANVQVDIFDDRIAISNIGSLIKPLTKEKLGKLAVRRNPLIADLFHRIGYVEKMGTGLKRIKDECKKQGTKLDIETNGYFIITFKPSAVITTQKIPRKHPENTQKIPRKYPEELTLIQVNILESLARDNRLTRGRLAKRLKLSPDTIKENIKKLREKGLLKRVGPDKGGYWKVMGNADLS